jgi:DHA1 family 2-module integral membrane pump EmrD-like MFS transporter
MHPSITSENKNPFTGVLFLIILVIATLAHVTADMYVPSLPAMTQALASNKTIIQLTITVFMLGFSLSHLIYGPLSDRIGRRPPLLWGIGLSLLGSLLCFIAPSVTVLILGRLLQGAGVGACNSVGRSLSRDLLSGNHLAKIGSDIGMVMVFVIAAAPTLGGYIQHYIGWRANFLVLLIYTLAIWLLSWKKLPETNKHLNPSAMQLQTMLRTYWFLLRNKVFMGFTLCSTLAYAGLIAYITTAPFLLQTIVGLTPVQYGWLSFFIAIPIFFSSFINGRLVLTKGLTTMIFAGVCLMLSGGLIMLLLALFGFINTWVIMLPVSLFSMGVGLTFANAFAGAFHPFPQIAGSAGALFGCLQILGGSLASAVMALLHEHNQLPLAIMLSSTGLLAIFCLQGLAKKEEKVFTREAVLEQK